MSPIAIIGIGCRFPQARGLNGFWRLLRDGVDAVTEVPAERWDAAEFYDPRPQTPGKMNTRWGAFLDDVDQFDPQFFGVSPREAVRMDPQQRLALEITQEALDDAGLPAARLAGSATGVYIGFSSPEYYWHYVHNPGDVDEYSNSGNTLSMIANRISYVFDLRGPSMSLDTACSSSLTAIHLACRSLQNRETNLALAGGVNLMFAPLTSIGFSQLNALSPNGRCRSFDAAANGYVRGEGIGLVILKRLQDALADGDRIHAVVRGVATNQDGRSNGITAPNRFAQEAVLRAAYRDARLAPVEVQYVEAHGSGTLLGDPIEAAALGKILSDAGRKSPCAIGSVKTNIGHAEAAAGIAGLIKTILAMQHGMIPASLHFRTPNPHIDFDRLPLRVQATLCEWPAQPGARLAGISSFGYGGSNAHLVLADAPAEAARITSVSRPLFSGAVKRQDRAKHHPAPLASSYVLTLSGRTPESLADNARAFGEFLQGDGANGDAPLDSVCYTASACRAHYEHRLSIAASSKQEMVEAIHDFLAGRSRQGTFAGRRPPNGAPKAAFVYRGPQGEFTALQRQLYEGQPVFRAALDECLQSPVLATHAGSQPRELKSLASLFTFEYALTRLWRSWGVKPHAVRGHWLGDGVAACIAGEMSPAEALEQIAAYNPQSEATSDLLILLAELDELASQGFVAAIEIGPVARSEDTNDLSTTGRLGAISPLCPDVPSDALAAQLAWLYARGVDIDWRAVYVEPRSRVPLPSYRFQRKRYWLSDLLGTVGAMRPEASNGRQHTTRNRPLKRLPCAVPTFEFAVSAKEPAWTADHRVQRLTVLPAAAVWETALAAARELSADDLALADVALEKAIVLSAERPSTFQWTFLADADLGWTFQLFGRASDAAAWTRYATGCVARVGPRSNRAESLPQELESLRKRLFREKSISSFYPTLAQRGLEYGPAFQGVQELWRGEDEALGRIKLPAAAGDGGGYLLHPALLDAALQVIGAAIPDAKNETAGAYVPVHVDWLRIHPAHVDESLRDSHEINQAMWSLARLRPTNHDHSSTFSADVSVYDAQGRLLVDVIGLRFERIGDAADATNRNDEYSPPVQQPDGRAAPTAEEILMLSGDARKARLLEYLRAKLAAALELAVDQLPLDQPLYDLGLDSLVIFKLAVQIEGELGVEIPLGDLAEGPTLAEFSDLMLQQLKE